MTKTPITDAALQKAWDFEREWVSPEVCRSLETAAQGLRDALGTMQSIQARMTGDGPPLDMYYVSAANAKTKEALARFDALKEGK